jgi:hypothetical protein
MRKAVDLGFLDHDARPPAALLRGGGTSQPASGAPGVCLGVVPITRAPERRGQEAALREGQVAAREARHEPGPPHPSGSLCEKYSAGRARSSSGFVVEAVRVRRRVLSEALGLVQALLDGLVSRTSWRRAAATRRVRTERIDPVACLVRALLRYGLEGSSLGLARWVPTYLVPRRSKSIEPSPLVYWGVRVGLVLHRSSPTGRLAAVRCLRQSRRIALCQFTGA